MRFLTTTGRRNSTFPQISKSGGKAAIEASKESLEEEQMQKGLKSAIAMQVHQKDILGKNYTPKNRHKIPPANVRQRMVQNQCVVYASLPCTRLREIKEPDVPQVVLAKRMWLKSTTNVNNNPNTTRHARLMMHRFRREGSVSQNNAFARRTSMLRGHKS
eukprot:gene7564-8402_t